MNRLAINAVGHELEPSAEYCRGEGIGIEITDFAFPDKLDQDLRESIDRHIEAVDGLEPLIAHGPLFDLIATSTDSLIVEVCHKRHTKALDAVSQIGVSRYVVHTNYNPLIAHPVYEEKFISRLLDFWLPYADRAGKYGVTICLENLWEPTPDLQCDIVDRANHPHLKATFDNGHPLVFSDITSAEWVAALGERIAHMHLHDNHGLKDEHLPVGDGSEDWPALLKAICEHSPEAVLSMENGNLNQNRTSIKRVKKFLSELQ